MQPSDDLCRTPGKDGLPPFVTGLSLPPLPSAAAARDPAVAEPALLATSPPAITPGAAAEIAARIYGIRGQLRPLSSERDANFHIRLACGSQALLKITNASEARDVTAMQTAALLHLARVDPGLPVQRLCATREGAPWASIRGSDGQHHVVRLLSYLDGTMLHEATRGPELSAGIGALLARLTRALRGFFHPAAGHQLQWDIKNAAGLRPLLGSVADPGLRGRIAGLLDRFDALIAPQLPLLRAQIVHNDLNPHNVIVDRVAASRPTGVIDFGDMVHTPLACDLAVACSYQIGRGETALQPLADLVAGYASVLPLEPEEIALLPDLIRLRHLTTLVLSAWRAARYPENAAYILRNAPAALSGLDAIDETGVIATAALLRKAVEAVKTE